jgi:hypothetical protein
VKGFVALIVVFVAGVWLGTVASHTYSEPVIKTHTVYKTPKTIVKTKTVQQPYVPADCKDAYKLAEAMYKSVSAYEKVLGDEDQVTEESYLAMTRHDQKALNKATSDHRSVIDRTSQAAIDLQDSHKDLATALSKCRKYPVK